VNYSSRQMVADSVKKSPDWRRGICQNPVVESVKIPSFVLEGQNDLTDRNMGHTNIFLSPSISVSIRSKKIEVRIRRSPESEPTLKELHPPVQGWPRSGLPWVRRPREPRTQRVPQGLGVQAWYRGLKPTLRTNVDDCDSRLLAIASCCSKDLFAPKRSRICPGPLRPVSAS
jgi:hypothetical protein